MNDSLKNMLLIGFDEAELPDALNIRERFERKNIKIEFAAEPEDTLDVLLNTEHDVYLLNFELNGQETFGILQRLLEIKPRKTVIILANDEEKHLYVTALKSGACDFLIKQSLDARFLERSVYHSFQHSKILAELRESQSKYKDLVEYLPAMFYISEIFPPYRQIYSSPLFAKFGYAMEDWYGVEGMWQSVLHPEDEQWVLDETNEAMANNDDTDYEYRIVGKNGEIFWVHDTGHFYHTADGETVYWQGLMSDITERKIAQEQLLKKLHYDELTGLRNRNSFTEKLEIAIKTSKEDASRKFAVFLLDIDRFKIINDSLGHHTGDCFLIETSRRLEKIVGEQGTVARLSGDEFAVIIDDAVDLQKIEKMAQDISQSLASPVEFNDYQFSSTASIGVTISDETQKTVSNILRNADIAMYSAKSGGKNCHKYYDEQMYAVNLRLMSLENELRYALERGEFSLNYQPIISLKTGKISQIEALLRWENAAYGKISPKEFIPVAEESGLINSIGQWVLEESCKQLKIWHNSLPDQESLVMSVNISAKQIAKRHFAKNVMDLLENLQLNPNNLCLEITETNLMENEEYVFETINTLHQFGVDFSMDDFGTGYSSLSYLHKFPFAELKIDISFIGNINADRKSRKIVRTIIGLARSLDLKIVAEGIECEAQLEQLLELDCDFGQGFYFAKPLLASEIEAILLEEADLSANGQLSAKSFDFQFKTVSLNATLPV